MIVRDLVDGEIGFRTVAHIPSVGRTHRRSLDLVLMQRELHPADTKDTPP